MSIAVVNQTGNQVQFNTDSSNIFIFGNRYEKVTFKNLTGGALTYLAGTVLGRVSATGQVTEMKSAAADGSQKPIGILTTEITALAGAGTIEVNMCTQGDVAEEKVIFNGANVVTTAVDGRIYRDWLQLAGIKLVAGTEMTEFDNQ